MIGALPTTEIKGLSSSVPVVESKRGRLVVSGETQELGVWRFTGATLVLRCAWQRTGCCL